MLWGIQGLLAALFLMAGGMKLFAYERYKAMGEQQSPGRGSGLSRGLVTFIGLSEVAGAIGLVVPWSIGVAPVLTPLAALGLATIMVLAGVYHARRQEPFVPVMGLFVLTAIVAVGRGFLAG